MEEVKTSEEQTGDQFPEGLKSFDNWTPYQIEGPAKVLSLSDIHIPYHHKQAVEIALQFGKDNKADTILLNGDVLDFHSLSFWETDPREKNFGQELDAAEQLFKLLRREFPEAKIIFKYGNHEERYERYLITKAPELLSVKAFQMRNFLKLDDYGIKLIDDPRRVRLGDLNVIHGHEYRFAISNPVNPARGLFLRAKAYATCGHFHQSSYHPGKNLNDEIIACWSSGCLCDLNPKYRPYNEWMHGFQFVEVLEGRKFNIQNKVIRDGKIY